MQSFLSYPGLRSPTAVVVVFRYVDILKHPRRHKGGVDDTGPGYTVDTAHLLISTITITRFLGYISSGAVDPNNEAAVYASLWADENELADVSHLAEVQGQQTDLDTCNGIVRSIFRDAGFYCSTIAGYIGDEILRHTDTVRVGLVIGLWPSNPRAMSTSDAASGSNPESIRAEGRRGGKNSKAEAQVMIGWISIDRLGVKRLKVLEWRTESKRTTHSSRQGLKVYEHDPNEFEILRCYWPYGTRSSDDTNSESSSSSGSSESETGYDSTRRPVRSIASYYDELDRRSRTPAPTRTRTLPPLNIPDPPPRRAPVVPPPLPESILRRPTSDAPHRSSRSHRGRHTSSGSTRADKAFQVTIVTAVMMLAIACAAFRLHSLRPINAMRDIPQNRFSSSSSPAAVDPWERYTASSTPHLSAQSSQTQSRFQASTLR